ncbi:MAG TPA: diguanylate cyclase [Solirubrobacteraceae bacterium]|nr:diguanylate cyclase [Solirubrobacteraceae bacterium]
MIGRGTGAFRPFASGGGRTIAAILGTFALIFGLSAALSVIAIDRSRGRAAVVQVADRQRTLAERYVESILLVQSDHQADPAGLAMTLRASASALLDGGTAPAVPGDDDETKLPRAHGAVLRGQLAQEKRLVEDLTRSGAAVLAHRPLSSIALSADERLHIADPIERVRVLAALTSNVSLNAARTIASDDDQNISDLITMQAALGAGGLLASLLLAWALVAATRRRTSHFRSLVNSSTDLVAVLGAGGCRYASRSFITLVGRPEADLLRDGFERLIHDDDRASVASAQSTGQPHELVFRMRDRHGAWRHLEAHITDLRSDRHVAGVVVNARDITERVRLEGEVSLQTERDKFGGQLIEALEMADEESAAYDVVQRAMSEISPATPMELLLSDSSRAHLKRVAISASAGAPQCPVESPFSCAAVRRGSAVVFESSEALNACPKLRGRESGPCSAACVPVGFMGRALGVLHVTAAEGAPPSALAVEQLTLLATQAGARIGTVRAFERSQLQAATDGLTGLPNRRTTQTHLRGLLKGGHDFALALADLDEFKKLNDKHGHEAGDRALRLFAQVCQSVLRDHDVVARWGGEEFVLVLPELERQGALLVLERIRERLAESHVGSHPRFTASFGLTDSTQAASIEQLLQIADTALYDAKAAGRDRIVVGVPPLSEPITLADGPGTDASPRDYATRARRRPAFHSAADEEEPGPNGIDVG